MFLSLVQALDVLERVAQDLADRERAALEPALGEAEDPPLGVVHQRLDVVLGLERLRDDLARGLDQLAQHGQSRTIDVYELRYAEMEPCSTSRASAAGPPTNSS